MEYLREETVEKEEAIETAMSRVGTTVPGKSSDKTKTPNKDVEVSQTIEGWPEQEGKVSLVDRIKTIGKGSCQKNVFFGISFPNVGGWGG